MSFFVFGLIISKVRIFEIDHQSAEKGSITSDPNVTALHNELLTSEWNQEGTRIIPW
jgi:hypothetical protein